MKFGPVPTKTGEGTILAHSVKLQSGNRLKKGRLLKAGDIELLLADGIEQIIVARLGESDIREDEAATRIAEKLANPGLRVDQAFTGRVNLFAQVNGLFVVNRQAIDTINAIDPAITIATIENFTDSGRGKMVATIKIIPYAVTETSLRQVLAICSSQIMQVHPYASQKVGLVATRLPSLSEKVMDKTRRVLEQRLAPSGSSIVRELRVEHSVEAISAAIDELSPQCELLIIFGASAISDGHDVIPQGLREAGGEVIRFGMPVDPGNLLMLGSLGSMAVIGAPGCSRSPAENGFDWILSRILAGLAVTSKEIAGMGVGGLLKEIGSRPQPRLPAAGKSKPTIAAIILAAGQSRRMGERNKLLAKINNISLLKKVVKAASEVTAVSRLVVVTGHERQAVEAELKGESVTFCHNEDYKAGLSTSLAKGISAVEADCDAVLVLLGDMPFITTEMISSLCLAFRDAGERSIIMATHEGKRGNPVLWPKAYFDALKSVQGDVGARHIIGENQEHVVEVELGPAASLDLDTPGALAEAGGHFD